MRFLEGETGLPVKEDDQKILSACVPSLTWSHGVALGFARFAGLPLGLGDVIASA